MLKLRTKLNRYITDYLDPKIIMLMDLGLSVLASFFVVFLVNYVTMYGPEQLYGSRTFAILYLLSAFFGTLAACLAVRAYKLVIRRFSLRDIAKLTLAVLIKGALMLVAVTVRFGYIRGSMTVVLADLLITIIMLVGIRMAMVGLYDLLKFKTNQILDRQRVLVFGTSDKSAAAATRLENSPHYDIVGYLVSGDVMKGYTLMNKSVYSLNDFDRFKRLCDKLSVRHILFANEKEALVNRDLVDFCVRNGIKTLVAPTIDEVASGKMMKHLVREVKIEDLLGRDEIKLDMNAITANFKDKVVMVTGAAGSIGSELCRQLATFGVKRLVLFDNAETPMHNIRLELEERYPDLDFVPVIGDVRQLPRLDFAFRHYEPQIVFHAAAYKHVPLMEENPCEAVLVNVYGSHNVADKCLEYGVEMMVMVSTDKAVNPTNIMGCTKRLAEIYVQSLGLAVEQGKQQGRTKFVTTRFGNVLGSNGSVIPRFREQIEKGGPVTVTHPDITRFFMTIPEACRLVMEAATMSTGNQIFVFDMGESVKIDDLAKRMIELAGLRLGQDIEIEYTGLRPGEKLYEEVLSNAENTIPTSHERIRIAKVREYLYENAAEAVEKLTKLAFQVEIPEMVKYMKEIVPEFKSRNSKYEVYDK